MTRFRLGVFDSGVGGLTVAGRVLEELPQVTLHYFGDTAHVPYGDRTAEEVVALVSRIAQHLVASDVDALVMACNTSSALAFETIRESCPVPVFGIIEAAAEAAVAATRNGRIGAICNPLTARSGAYERAARAHAGTQPGPEVHCVGCPRLVPLIEAGLIHHPDTRAALSEYLAPLLEAQVDTLILGCTHYPFLNPVLKDLLPAGVSIIDPGQYVVRQIMGLVPYVEGVSRGHRFEVSGSPEEFEDNGSRLLGRKLEGVVRVDLGSSVPTSWAS